MPRILVIDDDLGTLETFGAILRLDGWDVAGAGTGREGLNVARGLPSDAALVDVRLPDMTGIDVLQILRRELPNIQCVIMTAFGSISSAVDAIKLGARDYIEKPLTETDLLAVVRRALEIPTSDPALSMNPVTQGIDAQVQPTDWRVIKTLQIIEQRYRECDLRLSDIAGQLDVSIEHICRLLKRDTGSGFRMHLHQTRIREAERLLQQTNLSVKEIAYLTGYTNTTRLDHYFKRFCGVVPSVFRQRVRDSTH